MKKKVVVSRKMQKHRKAMQVRDGQNERGTRKTTKRRIFWKVYWILFALGALAVAITLIVLYRFMSFYEKAQPFYKMEEVAAMFQTDQAAELLSYETEEYPQQYRQVITEVLSEQLRGKEITYRKKYGEFSNQRPVYVVYAGDDEVATVYLEAEAERGKFNTKIWRLEKVNGLVHKLEDIEIVAPDTANVYVNGELLSGSDVVETVELEDKSHFEAYVSSFPKMVTYRVGDIYQIPEVKCLSKDEGVALPAVYETYPAYAYALNEHEDVTEEQAEAHKKFISDYVAYCLRRGTFKPIKNNFLEGTPTYDMMLKIKEMSVWAGSYSKVEISDIDVTRHVIYGPDAYMMTLDFSYTVYNGNKSRENPTILDIYYVKIDGEWKIVEMIISSNY